MKESTVLVALYGTLRRGGCLHEIYGVNRSHFIGKGKVEGYMIAVCCNEWFPRAFRDADESVVVEVFDIDAEIARRIIEMETDAGYRTEECSVSLDSGQRINATIFVCEGATKDCRKIPGGDWMARSTINPVY